MHETNPDMFTIGWQFLYTHIAFILWVGINVSHMVVFASMVFLWWYLMNALLDLICWQ